MKASASIIQAINIPYLLSLSNILALILKNTREKMNKIEDIMHKFSFYFTERTADCPKRYDILPGTPPCPLFQCRIVFVDFISGCGILIKS